MQKLIQGLHRFQTEVVSQQRSFFARLADGQQPETLFITCADSRISPNLLTQTGPGELFIHRNTGNLVPPHGAPGAAPGAEAATIEYAVQVLGVKDIIICGHSHCGAMAALLKGSVSQELPAVGAWLNHAEATRRIIRENYRHLDGAALLSATVEENVLVQLEALRTHPSVRAKLAAGQIKLHGWVYKVETGEVFAYNPASGQFERPADAPVAEPSDTTAKSLI